MHADIRQLDRLVVERELKRGLAEIGLFARRFLHPFAGELGFYVSDFGDDRWCLGGLGPPWHCFAGFVHQVFAAFPNEFACAAQRSAKTGLFTVEVRLDQRFNPITLGEQFFLVPMFLEKAVESLAVTITPRLSLIEVIGDAALGFHGEWGAKIEVEHAAFFKKRISTPRHEVKLVRLGIEIGKKVIGVAGVAIPKTEQSFHRPESVERIEVDQFADGLFSDGVAFGQFDQFADMRAPGFVVACFAFEAAFPAIIKIHHCSLIKCSVVIAKAALQHSLADCLDVRVHTMIFSVHCYFGEGGARGGGSGGIE